MTEAIGQEKAQANHEADNLLRLMPLERLMKVDPVELRRMLKTALEAAYIKGVMHGSDKAMGEARGVIDEITSEIRRLKR